MLEKELFLKYKFDKDLLLKYGFILENDKYIYNKNILNNTFMCSIEITDNQLIGNVFDLEFGDLYDSFRVDNVFGEFVNTVKDEYINLLIDIRDKCCLKNDFKYDQSNRISKMILDKYFIEPEYLFDDGSTGVFRNLDNDKWFGIIMNINSSKLDIETNNDIEVLNVKINKDDLNKLLEINGIFKAYHMNKSSWISIVLDNTLEDEFIMNLIDISYKFTNIFSEWVVPVNPKYFDVFDYYENSNNTVVKMSSSMKVGDVVYIYVGSPFSCIKYKCIINDIDVDYGFNKRFASVNVERIFDNKEVTFDIMKKYGVTAVRGARRITKELSEFINTK